MKLTSISRFLRLALILALGALLLPTTPASAQAQGLTYVVRAGDSLSFIATDFHTTVTRLLLLNYMPDPNILNPGTVLVLPGFEDVQGEVIRVTLPVNQSVDAFNRRTRVPADLMNRIDFITNPDALYAGQTYYVIYQDELPQVSIPVAAGLTDLELAAQQGVNPWLPAAFNDLEGTWELLPNDTLFLPADQAASGFTNTPSLASLSVSPLPLRQGKTTELRAGVDGDALLSGDLGGYILNFFPASDGSRVALQGIERMRDPGLLPLVLTLTDTQGATFSVQHNLLLTKMDYGVDVAFQVADNYVDPEVTEPEFNLIRDLTLPAPAERQWDGGFVPPSPYPDLLTSTFGRLRSYNGSNFIYFHSGLDFVGSTLDPVYAAANGTVVFSGPLTVRGNAVVISHGWGVYSGYWHLTESNVAVGDYLEAGRKIGISGATGRVTGPHLHFEIMVGGVQVDPTDWLNRNYADY
jgi:murein DD-endopeptidase MepM/ murein hydrolase activator NlpD